MDVAEAEALVDGAAKAGRLLTVFQNRRWDGDFQTVRSLIESGRLGSVDSLEARFERWSAVGDEWREAAEQAGGPHRDLGAHLVDQSLLLFGPASRVFAEIDRRRQGTAVEDSVFLAIDHASGVHSRIWTSLIAAHVGPRMRVRGTAGEYLKDALDVQEGQLLAGMRPDAEGFGVDAPAQWGTLYRGDGGAEFDPHRARRLRTVLRAASRRDPGWRTAPGRSARLDPCPARPGSRGAVGTDRRGCRDRRRGGVTEPACASASRSGASSSPGTS